MYSITIFSDRFMNVMYLQSLCCHNQINLSFNNGRSFGWFNSVPMDSFKYKISVYYMVQQITFYNIPAINSLQLIINNTQISVLF